MFAMQTALMDDLIVATTNIVGVLGLLVVIPKVRLNRIVCQSINNEHARASNGLPFAFIWPFYAKMMQSN